MRSLWDFFIQSYLVLFLEQFDRSFCNHYSNAAATAFPAATLAFASK